MAPEHQAAALAPCSRRTLAAPSTAALPHVSPSASGARWCDTYRDLTRAARRYIGLPGTRAPAGRSQVAPHWRAQMARHQEVTSSVQRAISAASAPLRGQSGSSGHPEETSSPYSSRGRATLRSARSLLRPLGWVQPRRACLRAEGHGKVVSGVGAQDTLFDFERLTVHSLGVGVATLPGPAARRTRARSGFPTLRSADLCACGSHGAQGLR